MGIKRDKVLVVYERTRFWIPKSEAGKTIVDFTRWGYHILADKDNMFWEKLNGKWGLAVTAMVPQTKELKALRNLKK